MCIADYCMVEPILNTAQLLWHAGYHLAPPSSSMLCMLQINYKNKLLTLKAYALRIEKLLNNLEIAHF